MKFIVSSKETGARLDQLISARMKDVSRSHIHHAFFSQQRVFVNQTVVAKNYRVKAGDQITIAEAQEKNTPISSIQDPKILFENEQYLVLDKPAGLVVHSARGVSGPTLVDFLLKHSPQIIKVGDDPIRPGIVHRLDKDASGVMVVAKTQEMFDLLKNQFKLRQVKKQYLVLVHGVPSKQSGEIRFPLARARHSPKIVARSDGGRASVTHYLIEKDFGRYALIRAEPQTGRTHQIRVHFFAFGYPIVGDSVYHAKRQDNRFKNTRLMLHAIMLGFHDLGGTYREYVCEPDKDFLEALQRLNRLSR